MSQQPIKRRGLMLVLSSPSGAGKTTISRRILEREPSVVLSVSATTRQPRPGEVEGSDYYFVSPERFEEMVQEGAFLEHARVFGNRYGTPRDPVENALAKEQDVIFDIDWQGTQQVLEQGGGDLVSIFILPPSIEELERRLRERAQDTEEVVLSRMAKAADEMSHWIEYDYVLVNHDLDECTRQVEKILSVERLRRRRQIGLRDFVETLRGDEG